MDRPRLWETWSVSGRRGLWETWSVHALHTLQILTGKPLDTLPILMLPILMLPEDVRYEHNLNREHLNPYA